MADKPELVVVVSGPATGPDRIALWEIHPDHPKTREYPDGGETSVAGDRPVTVALTPEVALRLRDDRLAKSDEPADFMTTPISDEEATQFKAQTVNPQPADRSVPPPAPAQKTSTSPPTQKSSS